MQLTIVGKNMELPAEVRESIERKVRKLERHLPSIASGIVEISQEQTKAREDRYVAQITISHEGAILRGEEKAADIYSAVKSAADVVDRRIERYKGLRNNRGRKTPPVVEETTGPRIVKEKAFLLQRMSTDDAAEQMELLGHNFFLFINAASDQYSLLYRREDGQYGLIEASFG